MLLLLAPVFLELLYLPLGLDVVVETLVEDGIVGIVDTLGVVGSLGPLGPVGAIDSLGIADSLGGLGCLGTLDCPC